MSPARLKTALRYRIESLLVYLAWSLFRLIGFEAASALGGRLASLIGPRLRRTITARNNLTRAMPGLAKADLDRIIIQMWDNIGRTFAEYPHITGMDDDTIRRYGRLEGIEHIRAACSPGKGCLFFTAHLGDFEFAPRLFAAHGYPLYIVFRHSNNPGLNTLIHRLRNQYLAGSIPKGKQGSKQLMETLKAGGQVGMLLDQKMNEGIEIPFFGIGAMTAPGIARLALKYGYPVLPVRIQRLGGVRHRVVVYPPLQISAGDDLHQDVVDIMTRINAIMEGWIRETPGQWFWLHHRWPDSVNKSITYPVEETE